jgi:hypothetical protein
MMNASQGQALRRLRARFLGINLTVILPQFDADRVISAREYLARDVDCLDVFLAQDGARTTDRAIGPIKIAFVVNHFFHDIVGQTD